jgi:hypothetical protein
MAKIIMEPSPGIKTPDDVKKEMRWNHQILESKPYHDLTKFKQGQAIGYQIMWYAGNPCRVPDETPVPDGWIVFNEGD